MLSSSSKRLRILLYITPVLVVVIIAAGLLAAPHLGLWTKSAQARFPEPFPRTDLCARTRIEQNCTGASVVPIGTTIPGIEPCLYPSAAGYYPPVPVTSKVLHQGDGMTITLTLFHSSLCASDWAQFRVDMAGGSKQHIQVQGPHDFSLVRENDKQHPLQVWQSGDWSDSSTGQVVWSDLLFTPDQQSASGGLVRHIAVTACVADYTYRILPASSSSNEVQQIDLQWPNNGGCITDTGIPPT